MECELAACTCKLPFSTQLMVGFRLTVLVSPVEPLAKWLLPAISML
jgi:hypothetical protein